MQLGINLTHPMRLQNALDVCIYTYHQLCGRYCIVQPQLVFCSHIIPLLSMWLNNSHFLSLMKDIYLASEMNRIRSWILILSYTHVSIMNACLSEQIKLRNLPNIDVLTQRKSWILLNRLQEIMNFTKCV